MSQSLRIGTRDSQLAVWQATLVQRLLKQTDVSSELVYIKSVGDIDTVTPLYALGVTGIFTKTLDAALLNNRFDIAVHSMKDVPTQMAQGIQQAAVLERASYKDIFVPHPDLADANAILGEGMPSLEKATNTPGVKKDSINAIVATSSIRRIAQWKRRYPNHQIENLRGNVNTRLQKLKESKWSGAIFAAAGLERIGLRPDNAIDLNWMLPAPAQGAIMLVCREGDDYAFDACRSFNSEATALCTKIEKDFLRVLMGGCSTPISALAEIKGDIVFFRGNVCSPDGVDCSELTIERNINQCDKLGEEAADQLLTTQKEAKHIIENIRNGK